MGIRGMTKVELEGFMRRPIVSIIPARERQEPRYFSVTERCGCVTYEEQGWCRHTAGADRSRYGFG